MALAWSDKATNPAQTEYIIMSHGPWSSASQVCPKMHPRYHLPCVKILVDYMRQLSKLSFPAYGSLYFEDGPLSPSEKISIGDEFCIGQITIQSTGLALQESRETTAGSLLTGDLVSHHFL